MKVGIHLPQWGTLASRSGVLDTAQAAEDAGLDSVWVADHIVIPAESASRYPYRPDGVPFRAEDGFLDALSMLAVVAGATQRVELGTSVLVLPMRDPLATAKTVATVDVLSGGRVVLAVGVGWWAEEFAALGQPFADRGRRMNEQIEIMRRAWAADAFAFDGEFYSFAELSCTPLPAQKGGPPILIGGMGGAALRRAADIGDGWHAVSGRPDALRAGWAEVCARTSRADLTLSVSAGISADPERALRRLVELRDLGVDNLVLNVDAPTVAAFVANVTWIGTELVPAMRAD